ncbi:MAG: sulfatase-like hydrolase/transferase [Paracoccaceae bacterium]
MTAPRRPSFVVFMTDQQRADHLGCYGNPVVQTPNLDGIAARGLRFERFHTATPICQPNRAALLTGRMPSANGCRQNGIPVALDETSYVDVLRAHGYRTGLVGKAHFQNVSPLPAKPRVARGAGDLPHAPFDNALQTQRRGPAYEAEIRAFWARDPGRAVALPYYGFDHLRLCIGHGDQVEGHYSAWLREKLAGAPDPRGRDRALDDPHGDGPQHWRTALPEDLYPTAYVADEAEAFLHDAPKDEPFFLLVSFPDPHHPFTPPGRYFDLYDPDTIPLPSSFTQKTGARDDLPASMLAGYARGDAAPDAYWPFHADADAVRRMIALNYGAITMIDDAVGRVLAALRATGRDEETVVCFMSDHGDYMGDHGTMLKHGLHTQGVIRVPFLWADPQGAQGVTQIHGSAIDFAPMVLQRAGIRVPVGMQGQDLLAGDARDLPVLIEDPGMGVYGDPDADTSIRSVVHGGWRLSVFEGSDLGELYDLNTDPDELRNLWAEPAAAAQKFVMMQHMLQRQMALRDTALLATHQA